jgi:hypothetical protein
MVVNFKARKISRGTHKLTRTPTLKKKKREREIRLLGDIYRHKIA